MNIGERVNTPHGAGVVTSYGEGKGSSPNYGVRLDVPVTVALGMKAHHAVCLPEHLTRA